MNKKSHWINWHFHHIHWNMAIVEFYLFQTLSKIWQLITNLFLPIYLFTMWYSIFEIVLFYVILQIMFLIFNPFSWKVIEKLWVKHTIFLQIPWYILFYLWLQQISWNFYNDFYLILLLLLARCTWPAFANVAIDVFMAKNIVKKSTWKMIAWLKIAITIWWIMAPVIWWFISYFYWFNNLFYLWIFLTCISWLPLFLTPDKHFHIHYKPQQLFSFILHKADKNYLIAEIWAILPDTLMWIMYPLFLYYAIQNTADLWILMTISAFISIMISYYIWKKVDMNQWKKYLKIWVKIWSITLFLRSISLNQIIIWIMDALDNILLPIWRIPYDSITYKVINDHSDQIKMSNLKQLISEIYYTLWTLVLLWLSFFNKEMTMTFFMITFGVFALLSLLALRMELVRVK